MKNDENSILLKSSRSLHKSTIKSSKSTIKSSKSTTGHFDIIDPNDYQFFGKIGKGGYGLVKLCQHIDTNKIYAMKILKKADILQKKLVEHVRNEYNILESLCHPFIVEVKGLNHRNPYTINFLMEYIPGGELLTLIKKNKQLSIEHAKFYSASIITIFDYLHRKNIIYRDLKPENILINRDGFIKLVDFGLAKEMINEKTYTICGTPEYCSPEMINKRGHGIGQDFWSLGILIYEMLVGVSPFYDKDPMKIYENINRDKIYYPSNMNQNAKTLIKHLLNHIEEKRLGCGKNGILELISHPFYNKYDWKGLLFKNIKPPYIPVVNGNIDTSNFTKINDKELEEDLIPVNLDHDPFYNW